MRFQSQLGALFIHRFVVVRYTVATTDICKISTVLHITCGVLPSWPKIGQHLCMNEIAYRNLCRGHVYLLRAHMHIYRLAT